MSAEQPAPEALPAAHLQPRPRRWSYVWLLPVASVIVALGLLFAALGQRGIAIEVQFQQGHGLKPGDSLRYRGIMVGTVHGIELAEDLNRINVDIRVNPDAKDLTRSGSRFWIVRPRLDLSGATGLETVVGANYLGVLPGQGEFTRTFVGLEEPPLLEIMEPGGLEIVLVTPRKGSLRAGAPVSYRQVIIGTILTVDLARDANSVQARVYIKSEYTPLIREHTTFWKVGGARVSAGLTGLSVAVDSVQSLILGGVNLAIPPNPGKKVAGGHVFTLHEEPESEWLTWVPSLSLYDSPAEADRPIPRLVPTILRWKYKNLLYVTREKQRRGWLLPVKGGLLGPSDLLSPPANAQPASVQLLLDGSPLKLDGKAQPYAEGLAFLPVEHGYPPWSRMRYITTPENTVIIAGPDAPKRFVPAHRYKVGDGEWILDSALSFDADWHGASVLAERDGALIGILLVTGDEVAVARVSEQQD